MAKRQVEKQKTFEEVLETMKKAPLFELTGKDGHKYKLYLNGHSEGFPEGTFMMNRAFSLVSLLEHSSKLR